MEVGLAIGDESAIKLIVVMIIIKLFILINKLYFMWLCHIKTLKKSSLKNISQIHFLENDRTFSVLSVGLTDHHIQIWHF